MNAVLAGRITPDRGDKLLDMLATSAKILEMEKLSERTEAGRLSY